MNINQLNYFLILSKTENYTKAAEILHITQPSLSNAIASLEEELGVKLFEKSGRNVILSKFGKEFIPYAKKSIKELNWGIERLNDLKDISNKTIRIAFLYSLSSDFIPSLISNFLKDKRNKEIRFQLFESNTSTKECTKEMIEGLKEDKFDAIFINAINEKDLEIKYTKVLDQNYVAIVNKNSELAKYDNLDLTKTKGVPFIQYSNKFGTRNEIKSLFDEINLKPNIYTEVEDEISIVGLVKSGMGFTITPMKNIYHDMNIKILSISNPINNRGIYIGYQKNKSKSELIKTFIDYIEKEFKFNYEI